VIWAALLFAVALAAPGVWAWYMSRRQLAATTAAQQRRVLRLAVAVSAGVGVVILVMGVVCFVLTGYNWLVLALLWSFGLLHLGLLARMLRRARHTTGEKGAIH
jgi:dipeptide/tripeptide permease